MPAARSQPRRTAGKAKAKAPQAKTPAAAGFLERLGVFGYSGLEPILLAALAQKAPVLLVGAHGTAKSLLVERVAGELSLGFRHYNAALLSYDDLVGIPMPDESGEGLRFIGTAGSIWGAEFAFFDEISRCRPDLQNKLFPVIHERRVAGVDLPDLEHRWAAMNPPASDDDAADPQGAVYLGSESLDPALADRFAYVVRVPGWRELSSGDRLRLVSGGESEKARGGPRLRTLAQRCARTAASVEARLGKRIADYVVQLIEQLGHGELPQSPRRARILARNVAAVHAARIVLEGEVVAAAASAQLALRHSIPQTAETAPPAQIKIAAAHEQAWELAGLDKDDPWRQVLAEPDSVARVALGHSLGLADEKLARLVTRALGDEPCDARRVGLATAMFLGFCERRTLTPAAWEPLTRLARRVIEPWKAQRLVATGPNLERWREISLYLAQADPCRPTAVLERGFLYSGFPDLWRGRPWREALDRFQRDLALFEVDREDTP